MPVMAVGVPVGVPAQVGTYKNPSVAVVVRATEPPATTLPAAVMRARSVTVVWSALLLLFLKIIALFAAVAAPVESRYVPLEALKIENNAPSLLRVLCNTRFPPPEALTSKIPVVCPVDCEAGELVPMPTLPEESRVILMLALIEKYNAPLALFPKYVSAFI